jgi:hypothetical protein
LFFYEIAKTLDPVLKRTIFPEELLQSGPAKTISKLLCSCVALAYIKVSG